MKRLALRVLKFCGAVLLAAWSCLVLYAWQQLRHGIVVYTPKRMR